MLERVFYTTSPRKDFDVLSEAEAVLNLSLRRLSEPKDGIPLWQAHMLTRGFSASNITARYYIITKFLRRHPTPDPLAIETYLAELLLAGRQKDTINSYISALKSFFGFLDRYNLWGPDPAKDLIRPKVTLRERRGPPLHVVNALLSQPLDDEETVWLYLFIDTGLRLSELASIRLDRIDLPGRWITVTGKGDKERVVPFSPMVGKLLERHIAQTTLCRAGGSPHWLFPARRSDSSTGYRDIRSFEKRLRSLCDRAGIQRICPHQLRHFFATYAISHKADIKAISQILGHANVGVTLAIYYHIDENTIKREHAKHTPLNSLGGRCAKS